MNVLEKLLASVRAAGAYDATLQVAPACILWPDPDRQWEHVIPRLQSEVPELLVLGAYAPEKRTGPAIWLRYALAGQAPGIYIPEGRTAILYLPGVSRQGLRATEACPEELKPLAELQYRGVFWSQSNAKDWTLLAFFKTSNGGLGLNIEQDSETKQALAVALPRLLNESVETLPQRMNAGVIRAIVFPDIKLDLLRYLNTPDLYQSGCSAEDWELFRQQVKAEFAFDPDADGPLRGAQHLGNHQGAWQGVWSRYLEAPRNHPNIPNLLRKVAMPDSSLFNSAESHGGWPQWNDEQERILLDALRTLLNQPVHLARREVAVLEESHGARRSLVWHDLGATPLADLLEPLARLARGSSSRLTGDDPEAMGQTYREQGWLVDRALIESLALPLSLEAQPIVKELCRQLYAPWADEAARKLQQVVVASGYPGKPMREAGAQQWTSNEAVLFVDGLRYDLAMMLMERLQRDGMDVTARPVWAALPTVTATAKPAVSPIRGQVHGLLGNEDFEPVVMGADQALSSTKFRSLLAAQGWQVEDDALIPTRDFGWYETGSIDSAGHAEGWKLPQHIKRLLGEIAERIAQLLGSGWGSVRVVTDHGWLLLPNGLPKTDLYAGLTANKWGRCASLKAGAQTAVPTWQWSWNPEVNFALAPGISCFSHGYEYAHGAISVQECVLCELIVTRATSVAEVRIAQVRWKGLRCYATIEGAHSDRRLDLRLQPAQAKSLAYEGPRGVKETGETQIIVENEDLMDKSAWVVVIDANGNVLAQRETMIGGKNA